MPNAKFYLAVKFSNEGRTRIGFVQLPDNIDGDGLTNFVNDYESMTINETGGSIADAGGRVVGISQALLDIKAQTNRLETSDLSTVNPIGYKGYLFKTVMNAGVEEYYTQPFELKGVNPLLTVPAGYNEDEPGPDHIVKQFLMKYARIPIRNGSGNLEGLVPDGVQITSVYKMH